MPCGSGWLTVGVSTCLAVYADLKPANCFLAEDGSIKIGDMNVSKVIKDGNARVSGHDTMSQHKRSQAGRWGE